METPKNQTAEVLYELLNNEFISRGSMFKSTGILNLPARISNLRLLYDLNIHTERVSTTNKYSRPVSYGIYSIKSLESKSKAINLYNDINK